MKAKVVLSFRNTHSDWIAICFWIAAVFVGLNFIHWLVAPLMSHFRGHPSMRARRKAVLKRLETLTDDEAFILSRFITENTRTLVLPSENPTVVALQQSRLIWLPKQIGTIRFDRNSPSGLTQPSIYHIDETAWQWLRQDA